MIVSTYSGHCSSVTVIGSVIETCASVRECPPRNACGVAGGRVYYQPSALRLRTLPLPTGRPSRRVAALRSMRLGNGSGVSPELRRRTAATTEVVRRFGRGVDGRVPSGDLKEPTLAWHLRVENVFPVTHGGSGAAVGLVPSNAL